MTPAASPRPVSCTCGHERLVREHFTGYQLWPQWVGPQVCEECGSRERPGDAMSRQAYKVMCRKGE